MLTQGDCIDVLADMPPGSAQLVYADPPFDSGRDHHGAAGAFRDRWNSASEYDEFMTDCLWRVARVLSANGSVWVHCDDRACHRIRVQLDRIMGADAFRAQVVWRRTSAHNHVEHNLGRVTDTLLYYARPGATFNQVFKPLTEREIAQSYTRHDQLGCYRLSDPSMPGKGLREWKGYATLPPGRQYSAKQMQEWDAAGRLHYPAKKSRRVMRKVYLWESRGVPLTNMWDDIPNLRSASDERTGWPTQKPVALLERIVGMCSDPGGLVVDPFCGSGTTLVAARRLGRRYAGCDVSADALRIARERMGATLC